MLTLAEMIAQLLEEDEEVVEEGQEIIGLPLTEIRGFVFRSAVEAVRQLILQRELVPEYYQTFESNLADVLASTKGFYPPLTHTIEDPEIRWDPEDATSRVVLTLDTTEGQFQRTRWVDNVDITFGPQGSIRSIIIRRD